MTARTSTRQPLVLVLLLALLATVTAAACAPADDLRARVQAIPGMRLIAEKPAPGGYLLELAFRQPTDHRQPDQGNFEQRLTLLHKSTDRPTVLYTGGYDLNPDPAFRAEPTELLDGNQITTEQRYFGSSRPNPVDWTKLDIWQAATDHHRLIQALRTIYRGAWISAGASKGGMASVYHRRFYPGDVAGTVAYSAPDNIDDSDNTAYDRFVEQVGTPECRAALEVFQRELLLRRNEIADRLANWAQRAGYTLDTVGSADRVVELTTLQVPMYFWMHKNPAACAGIPAAGASTDSLYAWFDDLVQLLSYVDQGLAVALPSFYQLGTQLGTARFSAPHLTDLLRYPGIQEMRTYIPQQIPLYFQPDAMSDIDNWVRHEATELLVIYGEYDLARAKSFRTASGNRDAKVYLAPATNHLARIATLAPADRAEASATLERWSAA